jgi:hypothetical protein
MGVQGLVVYRELAVSDVAEDYGAAMRGRGATCIGHGLKGGKTSGFSWRTSGMSRGASASSPRLSPRCVACEVASGGRGQAFLGSSPAPPGHGGLRR